MTIDRAKNAFDNYLLYTRQGEYERAGTALKNLEETLQRLSAGAGETAAERQE